jgi:hypothetical protein
LIWQCKFLAKKKILAGGGFLLWKIYASLGYHSWIFCFCDVMVSVLDFIVVDLVGSTVILRWDDDICFVLDQHNELDFYCTNSLKQQFAGSYRNVASLKTLTRQSGIWTYNVSGDKHSLHRYISSYKSNFHTITTTRHSCRKI